MPQLVQAAAPFVDLYAEHLVMGAFGTYCIWLSHELCDVEPYDLYELLRVKRLQLY